MLNVVESGKLVLTFQSIPPFVVESVFALTLAVLLAVPLILQVQHFLEISLKARSRSSPGRRANEGTVRSQPVVMHYPTAVFVDSDSSLSADLHLETVRRTISTPLLQASGDNVRNRRDLTTGPSPADKKMKIEATRRNEMPLEHSSSFIVTNSELPIVDISAFDYDVYRHKLIETALRKQYDDYQPPGDVVLNSIHLNTNDSTVAVRLNDRYHHSVFDFVEEYYDATKGMSKKEAEYLHPLDHFLVKGTQKAETMEKETETRGGDTARESSGQDGKSLKISFCDDGVVKRKQRGGELESIIKNRSRTAKSRPSNVDADPVSSKRATYPGSAARKSATKFSRTASSTDSVSSKRDTLSGSPRRDNRQETVSSVDGADRESIICTTISSIDSESVRSESSKHPDDQSCHSRDSSVVSKRGTSDRPQYQPFLVGGSRASFNRKYGNPSVSSCKTYETTKKNSLRNSGVLFKKESSRQCVPPRSSSMDSRDNLKLTSLARINSRSNELGKLEPIRSETEEMKTVAPLTVNNPMVRRLSNEPSTRPSRLSSKSVTESAPRGQVPESIVSFVEVTQQPPVEPQFATVRRTGRSKTEVVDRSKSPSKQSHSEKFAKRYRDRIQRSRTVSPAIAKVATLSPKEELSLESFPEKQQSHENSPVGTSTNKRVQQKRESTNENSGRFRGADKRMQENRQMKGNAKNSFQRRHTSDVLRRKEEDRESVAKLSDDSSRWKVASGIKQLKLPIAKAASKLSTISKPLQQKVDSKISTSLQDSVKSMPVRSSTSPSSKRKISRIVNSGRTSGSRSTAKENGVDELKIPCRDSKAGIAMQAGLKKYIKKLKHVLSDRDNTDIGELASLSLTDAILPEIEATLSSVEVQQVQTVLSMAEKESELGQKDLSVRMENAL